MAGELFELEMLGGNTEKRFRRMRPEVEAMPWGTLDLSGASEADLVTARKAWTGAAYQEHRTGCACALTLRALIEARAPIDLIAVASRFPLDEMVHVELCARMAMECGGGTEIVFEPKDLVIDPNPNQSALMRAAECCVRFFCVGEAISIPLLRATWHVAKHPLPKAMLGAHRQRRSCSRGVRLHVFGLGAARTRRSRPSVVGSFCGSRHSLHVQPMGAHGQESPSTGPRG